MIIEIPVFKGRSPITEARDLPIEYAQTTDNTDLSQGILKGFYKTSANATLNTTAWRSIFPVKSGATTFWCTSEQEAHFVNAPAYDAGSRFFYTDGVRGRESNYTLASNAGSNAYGAPNTSYYLGVPKPSAALTATLRGTSDTIVGDTVAYIYTFVTSWGYEGEPSDPTSVIDIDGGEYVELGNFETTVPTNYNIVGIRIYRTSTGSDETDYQFLGEVMTGGSSDYITPAEILLNGGVWNDTAGAAAQGTITMTGVATAEETFAVGAQTFTWKAARGAAGQVTIGANAAAAVTNIVTAITADLTTVRAADSTGDTVLVTAAVAGTAGNSIVFTESSSNMAVNGSDVLGTTTAGVAGDMTDASLLDEVITCDVYIEPPSALDGLIALPNGVVAAHRVREVYISEPFIHYGFPDDYMLLTHYDIKSIGHYGTTIVVGTEGNPYKINGYDPQALSMEKLPDPQSCLFTRAMVSGKGFVLYPSPDGLYMISDGGNTNATSRVFTKEQWKALLTTSTSYDKTIIAFLYDDKYYAFFQGTNDGFVIDFRSDNQFYATFSINSTYSVYGGYVDLESDTLYLLVKVGSTYYVREWEGGTAYMIYTWKSKVVVAKDSFFSCMKVNGDFAADSTGTGTITSTGTAVEGTGTSFTTELVAGGVIYSASLKKYREISSITDNDSLVLVSAFSSNVSGDSFKYNTALVNIYKDDSLFFVRALNATTAFRIPSGLGNEWEIEFKGDKKIYTHPQMAQSMDELS